MKNNFDELLIENNLKEKMHAEIKSLQTSQDKVLKKKSFADLSENEIFSERSLWKVFNRKNATKSVINGVQAEAFLSLQESTRQEILNHKTDCFLANHLYIEFYKFN